MNRLELSRNINAASIILTRDNESVVKIHIQNGNNDGEYVYINESIAKVIANFLLDGD